MPEQTQRPIDSRPPRDVTLKGSLIGDALATCLLKIGLSVAGLILFVLFLKSAVL